MGKDGVNVAFDLSSTTHLVGCAVSDLPSTMTFVGEVGIAAEEVGQLGAHCVVMVFVR